MSVQDDVVTEPAPKRRRGWVLGTISALLLALALAGAWLLFFDSRPIAVITILTRLFPLHIIVITIAALVVTGVAVRRRRRVTLIVAVVAVLVSATSAIIPMVSVANTASREGYSVSLGQYLSNAFTVRGGAPDESKSVVYASPGGQRLSLDVWPAEDRKEGKAVVFIHGGAWQKGSRGNSQEWNKLLNSQGFTVFDVDYRMLHDVPAGQAWEATVTDTKCALAWVAANASKYQVDPGRISVMGGSAGGHLSLMTAYTAGTGKFPPSCGLPEGKAKSVVDLYGPFDMLDYGTGPDGTDVGRTILRDTLGGSATEQEQRYRDWSPSSYVRAGLPPTLILHGTGDTLVPADQSHALDAALSQVGVPHRAIFLPFAPHGFDANWGSYPAQIGKQAVTQFLAANG